MTSTPSERLTGLAYGYLAAQAVHLVAELGIADALAEGPATAEELGTRVNARPDSLHRTLRLLETHGVFALDGDGRWRHTETSEPMRSDHPRSMHHFLRHMSGLPNWNGAAALEHNLRTGEPGVRAIHPEGFFGYLREWPEMQTLFGRSMEENTREVVPAVLATRDFTPHRRVVDVGGSHGHLAVAILDEAPEIEVAVFDLPPVVAAVPERPRLSAVSGDFFRDPLPPGDAYVLMHVIHDWDDDSAVAILTAVAAAARKEDAPVVLIEVVLPEGPEPHPAKELDVMMMGTAGGRERTAGEYGGLLNRAGLELISVTATPSRDSILEARMAR